MYTIQVGGYHLSQISLVLMILPKPLVSEFGIHQRSERCESGNNFFHQLLS